MQNEQAIASQFPKLVLKIGLSKTHIVKSSLYKSFKILGQSIKNVVAFRLTYNLELVLNLTDCKKRTISKD